MSLAHHEKDIALKSSVITENDSLHLFTSFKSSLKFDKNNSNLFLFWFEKL